MSTMEMGQSARDCFMVPEPDKAYISYVSHSPLQYLQHPAKWDYLVVLGKGVLVAVWTALGGAGRE
jgi:hypothetical protein